MVLYLKAKNIEKKYTNNISILNIVSYVEKSFLIQEIDVWITTISQAKLGILFALNVICKKKITKEDQLILMKNIYINVKIKE